MRQFDVFVFEENGPDFDKWTPRFTDPALGWFHTDRWNKELENLEAEWIVFAHPCVKIDRDFLNELAQETDGYPMVDAFAPRLKFDGHFYGGFKLDGGRGLKQISEEAQMGFVAAPHPLIGVFSRRIIQRTGLFDQELPPEMRLADYALRMAHAGGKMFNVPYLVAEVSEGSVPPAGTIDGTFLKQPSNIKAQWEVIYKTLSANNLISYTLRHPSTISKWFHQKILKIKHDKATSLSKLTEKHLKDISI